MSFVGPRPFITEEYKKLPKEWHMRLISKPGLSGLAQISGRSDIPMEEIIEKDIYWIENKSIALYFYIIINTLKFVLRKRNGY